MKRNKPKYKQIIEAAVPVFAEHGYHNAKVSSIAKQANVADGTIYLYFKNKEDILISVFQEKMGEFIEKIEKVIAGKTSAVEKLIAMVEMHLTLLAADPKLAIVTQFEVRQVNKELRFEISEVLKGYLQIIDNIIKAGIKEGVFDSAMDVRIARQMIFGTIDEIVTNWVMNEQKYDLANLSPSVLKLLIRSLQTNNSKN